MDGNIKKYIEYVTDDLIIKYHMTDSDAANAVNQSPLMYLMKKDSDMTMHYPIESWVDLIFRYHNHLPLDD